VVVHEVQGGTTLTDANGRVSNIIAVDVEASNGVIHATIRLFYHLFKRVNI
tara:strand:- start:402 stop:554 length:153 start_codon:yes stop_codon:yes gene_type:complete